ncbi:aminopeptidase N-like [Nylanderia fulva]|uniref:aminopeptidase N-like n=1 Tax=Nylanderia fulva TaxID=613905 RepID=UPI0010FB908E|nr:aminopeptidase N-like [Nylanderia fulva]
MPLRNTEIIKKNMFWTHFHTTPAMSPYLVTMLVSNELTIDKNKPRKIKIWCRTETALDIKFAENIVGLITSNFESYWKHSNNTSHVTHAAIPNFHDNGIMVFGLVLYRETDIIYDKKLHPVAHEIQVIQLVGHKVAQQWFYDMNNPFNSTVWFNQYLTTFLAIDAVDKVILYSTLFCFHFLANDNKHKHLYCKIFVY